MFTRLFAPILLYVADIALSIFFIWWGWNKVVTYVFPYAPELNILQAIWLYLFVMAVSSAIKKPK